MRVRSTFVLVAGLVMIGFLACKHGTDNPAPITPGPGNGGTIDTTGNGNPGPTLPDTGLCFERDILPIFISNCAKAGCHDAVSHEEGYVFTSYQTITSKKFRAGDADNTGLYEKITENDHDDVMPPPPNDPLSNEQIALIRNWINRGAPNSTGCVSGCDTTQFAFAAAIQPILNTFCKGCHNASTQSGGARLDIYSGVLAVAQSGKLLGVIRHDPGFPQMPSGGNKLEDCQIRQIEKWVESGAPNN